MEEEKIRSFKDLKVRQKGIDLVKLVYKITSVFPREEQFGIINQMRRSAVSVPANIAEGFRRRHTREQKQFLNIALGSCAELETYMIITQELGYIKESGNKETAELLNYVCAMLVNLSKKIA